MSKFLPITLFFLAASALAADTLPIAPPKLVMCENDTTCDRDPQHLEAFLAGFYKWYVAELNKELLKNVDPEWRKNSSKKKLDEFRVKHEKIVNGFLEKFLTPDLNHFRKKILATKEVEFVENNPHSCTPASDVDMILCMQDWEDEWMHDTSTKLMRMDHDSARLAIYLPLPPDKRGRSHKLHVLLVDLKPVNGAWRIDAITLPIDQKDNGK